MNFGTDNFLMPPLQLPDAATAETDEARQMRYRLFLDFFNGAQWTEKRRPGERRFTVNYARALVLKSVSYLFGRPLTFELIPNGPDEFAAQVAAETEQKLARIWDDNGLALVDYDTAVDAAVLGDGAFKVTLQAGGLQHSALTPGAVTAEGGGRIVVRSVDVMGLRAKWRGDDMRRLLWVSESYRLTRAEVIERWPGEGLAALAGTRESLDAPVNVNEEWTDYDFSITINGNPVASGLNPYGFIPYVVFPNISRPRQFWGQSDLEDIMSLNSELNVRVSVLSQLLQMSGNPVLVLENVDSAEGLRVGPGAVWTLPEGSKAYLLEMLKEGGVALHKEYINLLYRMLHDLAEMPASGFGRDQATSASSGVAIEQLLYPVVQRVNRKRRVWDEALDMRNRMILALAGLPVHRSRFVWPDIMPKDRSGLVTQEVGLVAAGIHSLDTARRNLGDEQPELEDDLILAERARLGGGATSGSNKPGLEMPVKLSGALVEGLSSSGG